MELSYPFPMIRFSEAVAVTPKGSEKGRYNVDIKRDWCIGNVPHGGYMMGVLANAVKQHFIKQYPQLDQPDLITSNYEFLGRSVVGPGEVLITVLKTGRQFSVARAQFYQGTTKAGDPAVAIEALVTQGNLAKEAANGLLSLPTRPFFLDGMLKRENCRISIDPLAERRPAAHKIEMHMSNEVDDYDSRPSTGPSVREQWVRWRGLTGSERGFDNTALAHLSDSFRPLPEQYKLEGNWYPTLNARLEVKKKEPAEGWDWLFMRIEMKVIRNGRFDYEVLIFDEGGELVCVSNHTALIVGAERNHKPKGQAAKI